MLLLINPDNPSGNFIPQADLLELAKWCKNRNIIFVLDESFSDFADTSEDPSLLKQSIIDTYENLIVIKSISKSFGVPGLRLGILASSNKQIISLIMREVAIWNINSFGEFFMQIWGKYRSSYQEGLERLKYTREKFIVELNSIKWLTVLPSQANYVMCRLNDGFCANELTVFLLEEHHILIKDLSKKQGIIPNQYIRLAVRNKKDNKKLLKALRQFKAHVLEKRGKTIQ